MNLFGVKPGVVRHLRESLSRITAPTLVVWGREDRTVPAVRAEATKGIPNVTVHIFDKCGHSPMFERPDEFNKLVLEFLR